MSDDENKKNRLKEAMGLYSFNFDIDDTLQNDFTAMLQENIYLRHFIPLLLSMTLNQPREYWENDYEQQLDTFDHSMETIQNAAIQESNQEHKTENTMEDLLDKLFVWFGPEVLMASIQFITQLSLDRNASILDLGCGNGHFTELLYKLGYKNLTASDFSQNAIQLAQKVHLLCNPSEKTLEQSTIRYLVDDITKSRLEDDSFDLVFDKGTLDSIAMVSNKFIQRSMLDPLYEDEPLEPEDNEDNNNSNKDNENSESKLNGKFRNEQDNNTSDTNDFIIPNSIPSQEPEFTQIELYAQNIHRILKKNGHVLIISCNHDTTELSEIFIEKAKLQFVQDYTDLFNDLRVMVFQKK